MYGFLVANYKYSGIRGINGYQNVSDLLPTPLDATNAFKALLSMRVPHENIHQVHNIDFAKFSELINKIASSIVRNRWKQGKVSFIYFQFSGHGLMDNKNYAVCSCADRAAKARYPLQEALENLA